MATKRKKFWGNNPKFKKSKSNNRFQILSDMESDENSSDDNEEQKEEVIKVPPIIVDSCHKLTELMKLLGKACKYKKMSIGTKIIANTLTEYDDIIIKLESEKYQFFTHPVKDNKRFKLMLFGLPKVDVKTLVDEFKYNFNIELANIKEIQTSRSNANDALYMLEFNRDQISKREVIKIKYVYDVVIHWRNPLRRSRGPTQCTKCAMYGHGSANCHRGSACLGCGEAHDYAIC